MEYEMNSDQQSTRNAIRSFLMRDEVISESPRFISVGPFAYIPGEKTPFAAIYSHDYNTEIIFIKNSGRYDFSSRIIAEIIAEENKKTANPYLIISTKSLENLPGLQYCSNVDISEYAKNSFLRSIRSRLTVDISTIETIIKEAVADTYEEFIETIEKEEEGTREYYYAHRRRYETLISIQQVVDHLEMEVNPGFHIEMVREKLEKVEKMTNFAPKDDAAIGMIA